MIARRLSDAVSHKIVAGSQGGQLGPFGGQIRQNRRFFGQTLGLLIAPRFKGVLRRRQPRAGRVKALISQIAGLAGLTARHLYLGARFTYGDPSGGLICVRSDRSQDQCKRGGRSNRPPSNYQDREFSGFTHHATLTFNLCEIASILNFIVLLIDDQNILEYILVFNANF